MRTIFILLLGLTSHACLSQEIKLGDTVAVANVNITKVEGQTKSGYTDIEYTLPKYLAGEINQLADDEMWDEKKKAAALAFSKANQKGGKIKVSIGRSTMGAANTKWFTIIIKKNGQEVLRRQLAEESAKPGPFWWNISIVSIGKPIELPFDVYIIDAVSEDSKRFHFRLF